MALFYSIFQAIAKIIEEASSTAPFILTQIDFGYPKDAVKVLGQLNSSVPVFFYKSSRPDAKCTEVVIYCPVHHEVWTWLHLQSNIDLQLSWDRV